VKSDRITSLDYTSCIVWSVRIHVFLNVLDRNVYLQLSMLL